MTRLLERRWTVASLWLALAVAGAFLALALGWRNPGWMYDAKVYRLGAGIVAAGGDLYPASSPHPFTYPPIAALLALLLYQPPLDVAAIAWTSVSLLCLGLTVWLCVGAAGLAEGRRRIGATVAVTAAACALDPVTATLLMGQVNLLLMAMVVADLLLPDGSRFKGLLVGLAAGIKLEPAFFVVYLLLTRRFRAGGRAAAAFAATVAAGFAVLPRDSLKYWSGTFLRSDRVGHVLNPRSESIRNVIDRWLHTTRDSPLVYATDAAVAAVALAIAVGAHRRGDELLAICVTAAGMLLVAPMTWQHHWVWVVPMLIWLGREALKGRSRGAALLAVALTAGFASRVYELVPVDATADAHLGVPQLLASSVYPSLVVVFAGFAAFRLGQQSHQTATPSTDSGGEPSTLVR